MNSMHDWARRFSQAVADGTVDACFDEWIRTTGERYSYPTVANSGPEFVPNEPGLYLFGADRTVGGKRHAVPRYVGKDSNSLRSRLLSRSGQHSGGRGRYVLPSGVPAGEEAPPQGWLACEFHDQIRAVVGKITDREYADTLQPLRSSRSPAMRGLDAFPPRLRASILRKVRNDLRLLHAVDWALHGGPRLAHLWVAFLPLPGIAKLEVAKLERELRDAAMGWRREYGFPPLLNVQDAKKVDITNGVRS